MGVKYAKHAVHQNVVNIINNRMYTTVVCFDSGNIYEVTDTYNRYEGYVAPGVKLYTQDDDGYYVPTNKICKYKIKKTGTKPSIYKRSFCGLRKDEYKYAFTERTSRTVVTDKDVYYNAHKDRFISKSKTATIETEVEYGLPHLICW